MVAEDATEEVFLKAWKSIQSCKGKEHSFSSWLYRVARNHTIDTIRKNKGEAPVQVEDCPSTIDIQQEVESKIEYTNLLSGVSILPALQKEIIVLKFIQGVSNREIEQITGRNQGAIRALQMRALARLRQHLDIEETKNGK
jgi:RNA polymerase sigma-70 factor (ECF subfamily)